MSANWANNWVTSKLALHLQGICKIKLHQITISLFYKNLITRPEPATNSFHFEKKYKPRNNACKMTYKKTCILFCFDIHFCNKGCQQKAQFSNLHVYPSHATLKKLLFKHKISDYWVWQLHYPTMGCYLFLLWKYTLITNWLKPPWVTLYSAVSFDSVFS